MTSDESAVIEAAKAYYYDCDSADTHNELMDAVRTLEEPASTFAVYYRRQRASRTAEASA